MPIVDRYIQIRDVTFFDEELKFQVFQFLKVLRGSTPAGFGRIYRCSLDSSSIIILNFQLGEKETTPRQLTSAKK